MSCTQHCAQKEKKIMEKRVKTFFIYNDFIYESIFYLINAAIIYQSCIFFLAFFHLNQFKITINRSSYFLYLYWQR